MKAYAELVPKNLTPGQKLVCQEECSDFLEGLDEKPELMETIITCREFIFKTRACHALQLSYALWWSYVFCNALWTTDYRTLQLCYLKCSLSPSYTIYV